MYNVQGTAPHANLVSIALDFKHMPSTLDLLKQNIPQYGPPIIMNNSWGYRWLWQQMSYGSNDAKEVDQVMYDNPDVCIVFAAGNDGACVGDNGQQQQIGNFAAAKNCITVGATYSDRPLDRSNWAYSKNGTVHPTSEMTTFSSTGPTVEGRVAPDVVAPGAVILSARSRAILRENLQNALLSYGYPAVDDLLFMDGTSMAAPATAGCIAVLRGAFRAQHQVNPTGALLKALLVHGAIDLVNTRFTVISETRAGIQTQNTYDMTPAPNAFQGYGLVDIDNSITPIIGPITGQRGFVDGDLASGTTRQLIYALDVPNPASSLVVTLAYTDIPGAALETEFSVVVELSDGSILTPSQPTDPIGRNLNWTATNVSKISASNPPAGQAKIMLSVLTRVASAKFAVVWTVT